MKTFGTWFLGQLCKCPFDKTNCATAQCIHCKEWGCECCLESCVVCGEFVHRKGCMKIGPKTEYGKGYCPQCLKKT